MAMSAYYLKGVQKSNVELMEIFRGIMPFLGIVIFGMFLMYMFPGIALWLPEVLVCGLKKMIDIFSLSVEEMALKIKEGQLTSVEVCEKYIERINKFEKDVKAWAHFDKKILLEKAADADEHRRSGKPVGQLHGIPVALKDIIGTVDMPTECGTPIRKGKSYSQNAEIVELLHAAGAIVMGKTTTSELAYLGPPKTTNPHDYSRTPGGSSSGSAASVASLMAPLSIGSQTGGSVIRPASYCGVVGYKPSYGLFQEMVF